MDNQKGDHLSSSIPSLPVLSDSTKGHSSSSVQPFFPDYIFERSVEHGTRKADCIPKTPKFNILSNFSTINIADLYSQSNTLSISNAPEQPANNVEFSESQFLIDYPIIRRRTIEPFLVEEGSSSTYHDTITQTDAAKDHCNKEGFISEQQQCSLSATERLQGRTSESTRGISLRTSIDCFSERNQTPVDCFSSCDEKTANSVSPKERGPEMNESRSASLEVSSNTLSAITVASSNATPSDTPECRKSKPISAEEPTCWATSATGFSEMTEEFTSKHKKRKVDHPKSESQFRIFFQRARSEDGSGCSGFKRSSVFQKWGQEGLESSVISNSPEKSGTVHSRISKYNIQTMDSIGPVDKADKKKTFRKWLRDRALCLSKPKNNNRDVPGDESEISLPERTEDLSTRTNIQEGHASSSVPVSIESQGKDALEKREEEDCSSSSPKSRPTRLRPRNYRHILLTKEHRTRAYLKERSHVLGRWFVKHFTHPYPSKEQKDKLAELTKMSRNQVSEWFGNMRRRVRDATRDLSLCWEERVLRYNGLITGKSEPLPIMPHDIINTWTQEVGGHHPEIGGHHPEIGGHEPDVRGWNSEVVGHHPPAEGNYPTLGGQHRNDVRHLANHRDESEGDERRTIGLLPQEKRHSNEHVVPAVDQEEHRVTGLGRHFWTQDIIKVICDTEHPTSQGRQLINHEVSSTNCRATLNQNMGQIVDYTIWRSQSDLQTLVVGRDHRGLCSFADGGQKSTTGTDIHYDGEQNYDLTSSGENIHLEDDGESSEDRRNGARPGTPAFVESSVDDRTSSTKFKRDLIHRFLNDSSDSLPTPSSVSMDTPVNENPLPLAKPDVQCSRRLFSEMRKRPDVPHTVPVARVDPWPCKKASRLSTKDLSPKNHQKEKSMSSNEDPLTLSYSSKPKTYSRASRPKPYYIIRTTSEPQSMVPQDISMHSSLPNLLASHNLMNGIYQQPSAVSSANLLPSTSVMETLRIPLCTSSPKLDTPNDAISGHQMLVQSTGLYPLPSCSLERPPAKKVFTWSFTARPALSLGHIGLQERTYGPASPSVQSSRLSLPSFPLGASTVTSTHGQPNNRTSISPQAVIHSSDEITAAYSLMQLQKM